MIDLTKWPRLLVAGNPVTEEQANDILIRTNSPYFTTNDRAWERQVAGVYGIGLDEHGNLDWRSQRAVARDLGVLDLHYLSNSRVMSCWIGGPNGWCDWDGRIGCSTYNIGKWPSQEAVQEDLDAISGAWPFLRMDVQLVTDEGEGDLAAMWVVQDGEAVFVEPGEQMPTAELSDAAILRRVLMGGFAERGVSIERLREAVAQAAGS